MALVQPGAVMLEARSHWDHVYATKGSQQVSWYRPHLETSMALIGQAAEGKAAAVIDVGGGASTLVDDLLDAGYGDVSVVDISRNAIEVAKSRLGDRADAVKWWCADATSARLPSNTFDVWHDRAVFHFLTDHEARRNYVRQVARCVKPLGHVIIGTFGPEGPTKCSGLDVVRYDADSLHREFGRRFRLLGSTTELHETPFGTVQQFLYCFCSVD